MNKPIQVLAVTALCFLGGSAARYDTIAHAQGQPSTTPYTVETDIYVPAKGDKPDYREVTARRSDGVSVRCVYINPKQSSRKVQFPDGRTLLFYDGLRLQVQHFPNPPVDLETQAKIRALDNGPCELSMAGATKLKDDQVMGYKTTVVNIPVDSDVSLDSWLAPELGCAQVKYTAESLVDGRWHVEPDPGEQTVLEEIRRLRGAGVSLRRIAAALNSRA